MFGRIAEKIVWRLIVLAVVVVVLWYLLSTVYAWATSAVSGLAGGVGSTADGTGLGVVLGNPFFVLALAGVVALVAWRRAESRLGKEELWRRVRPVLSLAGIRKYAVSHKGWCAVAGTVVVVFIWWYLVRGWAGFLLLVVPAAWATAAVKRREIAARPGGVEAPDAPMVEYREVEDPLRVFRDIREFGAVEDSWLVAGELYRSRRAYEHVLVSGRTGIGKGQTILIPMAAFSIAASRGSTVVNDPKGEVFEECSPLLEALRNGRGPTYLMSALEDHADELVCGLNPMCGPEETARFAASLVSDSDDEYWSGSARQLIEAVAKVLGYPADCVIQVGRALRSHKILEELKKREGGEDIAAVYGENEKTRENIRTTAALPFAPLRQERIARMFRQGGAEGGEKPDFGGRCAVFVCTEPKDAKVAGNLIAGLIDHLYDLATQAGKRDGPGVEFLVDEAATFLSLHKFEEYLSIARGYGVRFAPVIQNYSQVQAKLGGRRERLMNMLDSLPLKVFGQAGDELVAEYAAKASGRMKVRRKGPHEKVPLWMVPLVGFKGRYMANRARFTEEERPRIKADHVRELAAGEWFVLAADLREHVRGVPWHSHYRDELVPAVLGEADAPAESPIGNPVEMPAEEPPREVPEERPCQRCGTRNAAGARTCGECWSAL